MSDEYTNSDNIDRLLLSAMGEVKKIVKNGYTTIEAFVHNNRSAAGNGIAYRSYNNYPAPHYSPEFNTLKECVE